LKGIGPTIGLIPFFVPNKSIYAKRKRFIEPIFGQIKQVMGFRQFLWRGRAKIRAEWRLVSLTHNLLKLHRKAALVNG
jgi:hypothetical protein